MLVGRRQQRFDLDQIARKDSLRVPVSGNFRCRRAVREAGVKQPIITKAIASVLSPLTGEQVVEMTDLLRLLSEPTRLRVLLACLSQPASVGEIATRANLPRGLASHHLRLLRAGRFLRTTRNGKQIIYEPRDERVFCILSDLIGHIVKPAADDDE